MPKRRPRASYSEEFERCLRRVYRTRNRETYLRVFRRDTEQFVRDIKQVTEEVAAQADKGHFADDMLPDSESVRQALEHWNLSPEAHSVLEQYLFADGSFQMTERHTRLLSNVYRKLADVTSEIDSAFDSMFALELTGLMSRSKSNREA